MCLDGAEGEDGSGGVGECEEGVCADEGVVWSVRVLLEREEVAAEW